MKFKVYLLRRAGRRLAWREVQNRGYHLGHLVSHAVEAGGERYAALTLRADDPMQSKAVPDLYEPVLLGFYTLAFRLRGFERLERGAVVQEWHCELP